MKSIFALTMLFASQCQADLVLDSAQIFLTRNRLLSTRPCIQVLLGTIIRLFIEIEVSLIFSTSSDFLTPQRQIKIVMI